MGEFGPAIVKKDLYRHFRYFFNIFIIKIACRIGKNYFQNMNFGLKLIYSDIRKNIIENGIFKTEYGILRTKLGYFLSYVRIRIFLTKFVFNKQNKAI